MLTQQTLVSKLVFQVLSPHSLADQSPMNLAHVLSPAALLQPNAVTALLSQHNLLLPSTLSLNSEFFSCKSFLLSVCFAT